LLHFRRKVWQICHRVYQIWNTKFEKSNKIGWIFETKTHKLVKECSTLHTNSSKLWRANLTNLCKFVTLRIQSLTNLLKFVEFRIPSSANVGSLAGWLARFSVPSWLPARLETSRPIACLLMPWARRTCTPSSRTSNKFVKNRYKNCRSPLNFTYKVWWIFNTELDLVSEV
jgi:hypothetical protein